MPKKDQNFNFRTTHDEAVFIRQSAFNSDFTVSEFVICCVRLAAPQIAKLPTLKKIDFYDNIDSKRCQ